MIYRGITKVILFLFIFVEKTNYVNYNCDSKYDWYVIKYL